MLFAESSVTDCPLYRATLLTTVLATCILTLTNKLSDVIITDIELFLTTPQLELTYTRHIDEHSAALH